LCASLEYFIGENTLPKRELVPVRCPVCNELITGLAVEERVILEAKRIPVIVPARCKNGHSVVLFVDRNFMVRDVEAAGEAIQESESGSAIDKAQKWIDSL